MASELLIYVLRREDSDHKVGAERRGLRFVLEKRTILSILDI